MFEGVPNYPDNSRFWNVIDKHKVNTFYTAPTAIRALMRAGDEPVIACCHAATTWVCSPKSSGNFPQAYSHVGLINCALNLTRETCPAEVRAKPQPAARQTVQTARLNRRGGNHQFIKAEPRPLHQESRVDALIIVKDMISFPRDAINLCR
jgi:hypothetical protein